MFRDAEEDPAGLAITFRMNGTLNAFRLATYDRDKASELVKRLYGQRTSSHGGTYAYRRKGLPDGIPHRRRIRGVVIVRTEDAGRAVGLLETLGAEVHAGRVELAREDREAVQGQDGAAQGPESGEGR